VILLVTTLLSVPLFALRGQELTQFLRRAGESVEEFYRRFVNAEADRLQSETPSTDIPTLALLYRGDVDLPEGSSAYVLFREGLSPSLAASDLLA